MREGSLKDRRSIASLFLLAVTLAVIGAVTRPTKQDICVLATGLGVTIVGSFFLLFVLARISDLRRVIARRN